jgi:hypothetical protein
MPVPIPVRRTASQKRAAPGRWSVEGIASRLSVDGVLGVVNAISAFVLAGAASLAHEAFTSSNHVEFQGQLRRFKVVYFHAQAFVNRLPSLRIRPTTPVTAC